MRFRRQTDKVNIVIRQMIKLLCEAITILSVPVSECSGFSGIAAPAGAAAVGGGGWLVIRLSRMPKECKRRGNRTRRLRAYARHVARASCPWVVHGRDAHATGRHAPLQALAATTPRQRTARLCRATTGSTGSPGSTGRTEPPCAHRVGERSEVSVRAWVPQEPLAVIRDLCVPCALAAASSARARSRGRKRGQVRAQNRLRT